MLSASRERGQAGEIGRLPEVELIAVRDPAPLTFVGALDGMILGCCPTWVGRAFVPPVTVMAWGVLPPALCRV